MGKPVAMARTDDDSWDITEGVGQTALGVAMARADEATSECPLFTDPYAQLFLDAAAEHGWRHPPPYMVERIRSISAYAASRTKWFDEFFIAAGASGIEQAVILAAGLDARAWRLPWVDASVVYEIDQPGVIDFKTRTLADLGAKLPAERRTVAIDLRDDWPAALIEAGFDASKPTAWSAEGLLVYLPPEAQDRLFDNVAALSAPGSRIACEHMDFHSIPADWAEKLTERAQRIGSKINLAELFYTGDRNSAGDYLTEHGWRVDIRTTEQAFSANGFQVPQDELASFGGASGYLSAVLG